MGRHDAGKDVVELQKQSRPRRRYRAQKDFRINIGGVPQRLKKNSGGLVRFSLLFCTKGMKTDPAVAKTNKPSRFWNVPAFRFSGKFLLFLILLGGLYSQLSSRWDSFREGFTGLTAKLVGACYALGGAETAASGSLVTGPGIALLVIEECTGAYEMIIFAAAVLAFPTGWRKKGLGLLFGLPLLYAVNILRMMLLAWVQAHGSPGLFDFMHVYFWQATLILMILGVFILWIKLTVYRNVQAA